MYFWANVRAVIGSVPHLQRRSGCLRLPVERGGERGSRRKPRQKGGKKLGENAENRTPCQSGHIWKWWSKLLHHADDAAGNNANGPERAYLIVCGFVLMFSTETLPGEKS